MQVGWVQFSPWEGMCVAAITIGNYRGEEESSLFLPLTFISLINVMGVFGGWFNLFLFCFWLT